MRLTHHNRIFRIFSLTIPTVIALFVSGVSFANTGTVAGKSGVALLMIEKPNNVYKRCSGVIIHPKMLLTASHCIGGAIKHMVHNRTDNNGTDYQYGRIFVKVQTTDDGTNFTCQSSNSCNNFEPFWFMRLLLENDQDTAHDIMYIYRPDDFQNPPESYAVLDTGVLDHSPFSFYGTGVDESGANGGIMRRISGVISSASSQSYSYTSGARILCRGDSGGPYYHQGLDFLIGIASSVKTLTPSSHCTGSIPWPFNIKFSEKAYKINLTTIDWINWTLDTSNAADSPRCVTIPNSNSRFDCSGTYEPPIFSSTEQCRLECQNFYFSQFPFNETGYLSCIEDC